MPLSQLKAVITKKFHIKLSLSQCRRENQHAVKEAKGSLKKHYVMLWSYGEEIRMSEVLLTDHEPQLTTLALGWCAQEKEDKRRVLAEKKNVVVKCGGDHNSLRQRRRTELRDDVHGRCLC